MERLDSVGDRLEVTVDGAPLELPKWLADSLTSIRTYLECVAMKQERVLWSLLVDGQKMDLAQPLPGDDGFRVVRANTITFEELRNRLISAGREKVADLISAMQPVSLMVLINGLEYAKDLWFEWEPQLREPLFSLRALQELDETADDTLVLRPDIANYLEHLTFICLEVESLFIDPSFGKNESGVVSFSEILDCTLVPLLKKLEQEFQVLQSERAGR